MLEGGEEAVPTNVVSMGGGFGGRGRKEPREAGRDLILCGVFRCFFASRFSLEVERAKTKLSRGS